MRLRICAFVLVGLVLTPYTTPAWAVAITLFDPGFDIYDANTLNLVADDRFPNQAAPGAGSGPLEDVPLLNFDTFAAAGFGDYPAGWTAIGQRPNGANNTGRGRCDDCFLSDSGTVAVINSFGSDVYEQSPGVFVQTPGIFLQTLTGVAVQANALYTATIQVSDLDITNRGPFQPPTDNIHIGDKNRIKLILLAGTTDLGGVLEWSDITSGGAFKPDGTQSSGGKSLLTLTILTGATVPTGDLTIAFTGQGVSEVDGSFGASTQTYFDNATLDVTPFAPPGVEGDYNNNGLVDAADYVLWRNGGPLQNEVDSPGTVNDQDYTVWRARFGNTAGSGSSLKSSVVPEPVSSCMLIIALLGFVFARNRITNN